MKRVCCFIHSPMSSTHCRHRRIAVCLEQCVHALLQHPVPCQHGRQAEAAGAVPHCAQEDPLQGWPSTGQHALHSLHCTHCTALIALHSLHCTHCTALTALHSLYFTHCIALTITFCKIFDSYSAASTCRSISLGAKCACIQII